MSADALLWIATLLFSATMLILAARRRSENGEGEGGLALDRVSDSWEPRSVVDRGIDLGGGWTLGGAGDWDDRD